MGNLLAELKRRNIFRVGAAYAVVAWVLLQLVNNLTPALKLPQWASSSWSSCCWSDFRLR